jgi:hypothetical protein
MRTGPHRPAKALVHPSIELVIVIARHAAVNEKLTIY